MAGRGVDETGAGVVGNVLAFEHWDAEFISTGKARQRVGAFHGRERRRRHFAELFVAGHARLFEYRFREGVSQNQEIAGLCPVVRRRVGHLIEAVNDF